MVLRAQQNPIYDANFSPVTNDKRAIMLFSPHKGLQQRMDSKILRSKASGSTAKRKKKVLGVV